MDTDILHNECSKTEKQGLVPERPGGKNRGEGHPRKAAGALSQCSSFALVASHLGGHRHLPGTPLSLWTSGKGTPMYAAWSSEGLAERLANWEQRWFSSSRQRTRAASQAFVTSRGMVDYSQQIPEHCVHGWSGPESRLMEYWQPRDPSYNPGHGPEQLYTLVGRALLLWVSVLTPLK